MKLNEFYYDLPKDLIAQEPLKKRDTSRLMVLDRSSNAIEEKVFSGIGDYIKEGDCLVLNDTRVIPVRLYGKRKTGGKVEIFLLDVGTNAPRALVKPSKKIKEGEEIELEAGVRVTVLKKADLGRYVKFNIPMNEVYKIGHMPLPPYISRLDIPQDRESYQTVYARHDGATAAPTAGLHFTKELLSELENKGVRIVHVTLHTSYGTFAPVKEENIEDHVMHVEHCELSEDVAKIINDTKSSGGKVFAVGTTSTRTLESAADDTGKVLPFAGDTGIFIYPGYKFKAIDGLITNFHLPESTLLMLVSALAGREFILEAYAHAIKKKFRFFSYGDAMLII